MLRILFFFFILLFFCETSFSEIRSLKNNKVNVRLGPSKTYPVKWIYTNKYLPVEIIDEQDNWKKIKDFENDVGWVHISQLSRKKSTLTLKDNLIIFSNPTIYSKPKAKVEIHQVFLVDKCIKSWCLVKNDQIHGWITKEFLWGMKE